MVPQFGTLIPSLPFTLSGFEAVLLSYEYPTTVIYQDIQGDPIIKEWVDCSEDSSTDRYYYYRTSKVLLKRFLSKEIPYQELINQNIDGYVVFEDKSLTDQSQYFISSIKTMPTSYLPQSDYYFDRAEAVDLLAINDYFKLDEVLMPNIGLTEAKEISLDKKSETLFIHFKKGKGIGFGTANTEVLAKTLLKFDRFYKETALDFKLGTQRGEIQLNAKKNEEYLPYTNTEVYGNIAASYAILIRPAIPPQMNLFENSDAERISSLIFSLINNSDTVESLKNEYPRHSDFTLKAYKAFVEEIYSSELNISLNWFSPISKTEFTDTIDYVKANLIKNNLENLSIEDLEKFTVKGKFRSLNCDTGHFTFISTGGEKYYGHMDDLIKEGSEQINFIDIYEITVSRTISKEAGTLIAKIKDTILAFIVETH
jgi:hypothetical protein